MHAKIAVMVVLVTVVSCGSVLAARSAWVLPEALIVRQRPTTESDRVASVSRGAKVTVTAFTDSRWCKVSLSGGKTGWVMEKYLTFSSSQAASLSGGKSASSAGSSAVKTAWIKVSAANFRKAPELDAAVVRLLRQGEKVFVVASDGQWRKIKSLKGEYGWVRSDMLEFNVSAGQKLAAGGKSSGTSSATSSGGGSSEARPAWVSANVANVRSGPSEGYSRVSQFTRGVKVHVVATQGGWAKCKGPDATGWIHGDLLEKDLNKGRELARQGRDGESDKAYCIARRVNLRSEPSESSASKGLVTEGTVLWIQGEKDRWCKVTVDHGATGWVAGWYVRRHGAKAPVAAEPGAPQREPENFPSPDTDDEDDKGMFEPFKAWVAEDGTCIRYGPGLDENVKSQAPKFSPVLVDATDGQWCHVKTESGTEGWIAGWVLDFQPPGQPEATKVVNGTKTEAKVGWVSRPVVNVRAAADTDSNVVTRAEAGTELVIIDQDSNWYKVATGDGKMGWVAGHLIETREERRQGTAGAKETSVAVIGSGSGARVVREAMTHLGKPYSRGSQGPNVFDCSGFTHYVYGQFGLKIPRTSGGQYTQCGRPVDRDVLQQGDLVVFRNTYKHGISHVGIYIGQGKFIHASNSRSGVKISDLDSSYYASRWAGARRLF